MNAHELEHASQARRERRREPVYTLKVGFTHEPIVSAFGIDGLVDVVPRLEPDVYVIDDAEGKPWGVATVFFSGRWDIDGDDFKAGPGYIIV